MDRGERGRADELALVSDSELVELDLADILFSTYRFVIKPARSKRRCARAEHNFTCLDGSDDQRDQLDDRARAYCLN